MRIAFFSAALAASSFATAAVPIDGLYYSLFGGYTYISDHISQTVNGIKFERPNYKNGFNAGGRFGYQANPLRFEGEFTYFQAEVEGFYVNPFHIKKFRLRNANGQAVAVAGTANIYYDFPEMVPCIAPFVGLGIGYGWVTSNLQRQFLFNEVHFKGNDSTFVYQGTAGFTYNFSESYALNIAYRYFNTTRLHALGRNLETNSASIGAIYRFNEYNYK